MKNIFKTAILAFVLAAIGSCTNDKDPVVSPTAFELRKDATVVSPLVLLEANNATDYAKFNWDRSTFGANSVPSYKIVISDHDADPNLLNPSAAVEDGVGINPDGDARSAKLTVEQFNVLINRLPTFNCGPMNIDIRIKSKLGVSDNALYQYSNPITLAVTGYAKKQLFMVLARDTDTPAVTSVNKIVSSAYNQTEDYEGFMYLEAGNYKLHQPDPCGGFSSPTVYGLSGNSGTLVAGGTTYYNVPVAGHYFVTAKATAGTYTITPFNNTTASNVFGIFGNATRTALFQNTTPMAYDPATKNWTVTIELINGKKYGFKTGNGSAIAAILVANGPGLLSVAPASPAPDNAGSITAPGAFVDNTTKTRYNVVVNVSNPRQYTYSLTPNPL